MYVYRDIGKRLKFYRKLRHITQKDMADKAGVTMNHLSKIERCICTPNANILLTYIKELDIPVEELYG